MIGTNLLAIDYQILWDSKSVWCTLLCCNSPKSWKGYLILTQTSKMLFLKRQLVSQVIQQEMYTGNLKEIYVNASKSRFKSCFYMLSAAPCDSNANEIRRHGQTHPHTSPVEIFKYPQKLKPTTSIAVSTEPRNTQYSSEWYPKSAPALTVDMNFNADFT